MRAKIIKRWAIFITVLSLIGGTGFITQRLQVEKLAKSVVEQADIAAKEGKFAEAERLYREHLIVIPDDVETKIKYADAIVKANPLPWRQDEALQIYNSILIRDPGNKYVRRKQMELKVAMGRLSDQGAEADLKILLNLAENKDDGHLMFLMGRCCEAGKNDEGAERWYRKAIEYHAPERIEAYEQLATVLRRLEQPKSADRAIQEMVQSDRENYVVYLARGRYLLSDPDPATRKSRLALANDDLQKALELAPTQPGIYLELARIAAANGEQGNKAAQQKILETGLTKAPASAAIYDALANLELQSGHIDQAVQILERGLKSPADKSSLHWRLANILAGRGDTGSLLLQIEELRKIGVPSVLVQFLQACYHINAYEFREAHRLLVPIESTTGLSPDFKARVNDMLARCYSRLGEPGMQHEAYLRALRAKPDDVTARLGLINRMVNQGEFEAAIKEYRALVKQVPQVSLPLARLLIARNRQRPAPQRDWDEVKNLIDAAEKSSPQSDEVPVVRNAFYIAQDKFGEAWDAIEKAKSRFPKSVVIWCAQAELLGAQKQFDDAQRLLDRAKNLLGDRVELRLERAKLSATKGGPQVVKDLNELSQNLEPFSREDRRKLLDGLVRELMRQQDSQDAIRLWSRLAEQEPNDLELRLNLLDLAFQIGNSDEIDENIKQIGRIEGSEGVMGRYCQVRYLSWQAQRAGAKDPEEARRLRTKARVLLSELASGRADWSVIPLAFAELEQQELAQLMLEQKKMAPSDQKANEIQAKEESIIRSYRKAIDLGQHGSAVVRRTVQLLFKNKRGSEALELLNSIPVESQLAGDLGRQAAKFAVDNRDFQRAADIARKMVAANPGDFQERIWLVQILLSSGNLPDAEIEIKKAVELAKAEPNRWIMLVQFMVQTRQPDKAVKAVKDAEAFLPPAEAPLALAQCCELLGESYEGSNSEETKKWYAEARKWFEKARAAQPDDLAITRRMVDFFRRTKQIDEAEAQLGKILARGANSQNAQTFAWARRTLALTLASSNDIQRARKALLLLEPAGQAGVGGKGANALDDPDDQRALAQVLAAQRTVQDRKRAIEVLESLVARSHANAEDRFLLAQLHEMSGDWPKARDAFRDLNLRVKNLRDLETLRRRPLYLARFASGLLRNHQAGDDKALAEAQVLVEELNQLQPNQFGTVLLQVEIYQARNQVDQAVELIQSFAKRPELVPQMIGSLAQWAEKLGRADIAEPLYRRYAALLIPRDGTFVRALFLGRQGRVKDALDLCEPLWANPQDVERVAEVCMIVLTTSKNPPDRLQIDRVAGWLEQATKQKTESTFLLASLAGCRERQTRYDEAKALYERTIEQSTRSAGASSSTNKVIANSYNNLAWLLALTGSQGKDALVDIDRAIKLEGPLPDYLDTRGIIYLRLNQTQDAINDLRIAVKDKASPARLFHLTQAYLQANDKGKAKEYWKDAQSKKLDQVRLGPGGLHPLELSAYQKVLGELGMP